MRRRPEIEAARLARLRTLQGGSDPLRAYGREEVERLAAATFGAPAEGRERRPLSYL